MDNLKLRQATPEDNQFAYRVKKAAFKKYVEKVWGWKEDEQRRLHRRRFAAHNFRVIQISGVDVGIVTLVQQPDCLKVNQLFILPEYQNKGIGAACMNLIIQDASALKLPVRLQVLKVNKRAFAFFEKLGFKIVSKIDTHIMMEKPL